MSARASSTMASRATLTGTEVPVPDNTAQHAASVVLLAQTDSDQSWLDWLFGLSRVSWADADTVLGWRYALPAWGWALIVIVAVALAAWSYSRMLGPRAMRIALASVRAVLLLLVAALLAGPTLVRHDERIEPDWLLALVDRSASMQIEDRVDATSDEPLSRDAQLRRAIEAQAHVFDAQSDLIHQRELAWLGFGEQVTPIDAAHEVNVWPAPDAPATHLRDAIEQALRRAAGQPVSGIVLFTDGRSTQATGADLVMRLQQQGVPVFTVPLGAERMPLDLALGPVDHPERAFVDDVVPVSATINQLSGNSGGSEASGEANGGGEIDPAHVRLRLVDVASETVLDERTLEEADAGLGEPVRLTGQGEQPGEVEWRVEVIYEPTPSSSSDGASSERELITRNNERAFTVELIDRPIRVLYVDGYPRWEYRYLKNLLIREASIESSMMLVSADREFAQEGDEPIARLPRDAQELEPYDVVILGDIAADYFTNQQVALLRDHVAAGGAGLLWIGGPYHTPTSYAGTPLADLLPMRHAESVRQLSAHGGEVELVPTPLARNLAILSLREPSEVEGNAQLAADHRVTDWPDELPPLRWAQSIGALKPTAEPLAVTERSGAEGEPEPIIARLRYGAGQSLYVATDDAWRWRYGRGAWYYQQFWLQLVRMLGRARVQEQGGRAQLTVSHQRVDRDRPVVVELVLRDPVLLQRQLPRITVDVHRLGAVGSEARSTNATSSPRVDQFELLPVESESTSPDGSDSALPRRVYRATWRPDVAGTLALRVAEAALDGMELERGLEVVAPDDELRQPQPDHARLARLANETGGAVVPLDELDRLAGLVPNRDRRIPNDVSEPLWNSSLVLVVILVLLTTEWILRKVIRLV